jgi:hypothetical protein
MVAHAKKSIPVYMEKRVKTYYFVYYDRYVPGYVLDCYIPQWFHGRVDREEAERMLNKTCRDGTFLLRERVTKQGSYALSVWCPDQVVHVPLGKRIVT